MALPPESGTRERIGSRLSGVPLVFLDESNASQWASVEAMLVGSVARIATRFDAESRPRLRFVQVVYTGLDRFPFDRFAPTVEIAGNVGGYAPFVAEHAVALALASARQLPSAVALAREGRLRPAPENRSLRGQTATILGFGEIGHEVAQRLRAFGMKIVTVGRVSRPDPLADRSFGAPELAEALAMADLVVDARPLTDLTRHSIGARELNAMKPTAIYVNVGRAATIDERTLFEHLKSHPEFRAATDPWWDEDFAAGTIVHRTAIAELPNFLGTPHNSANAPGAREYALDHALENLARFFRGERPLYVADRQEYQGDSNP
ncbi:MAG: 2-hydroxyacid dehydrogenase [Thermoplasmata archaeon]